MARIRTIKPSFWSSLSNADLPISTRLTWIGLWNYVDDKGRGVDDARLIKAAVWPLDDAYTAKKVTADLHLLTKAGKIGRYEVDGQRYLAIVKWKDHQRIDKPQKSILPPAPWEEDSGNVPGMLPPTDGASPGTRPPNGGGEGKGREVEGKGSVSKSFSNHHRVAATTANGEMETSNGQKPDPVAERLLTMLRPAAHADALDVLGECRKVADELLVDEVVGHMLAMASPPTSPTYLAVTVADWLVQRGAYGSVAPEVAALKAFQPGKRATT